MALVLQDQLAADLMELSTAFGPPGFEGEVAALFRQKLGPGFTHTRDRLGSAIASLPGTGPRIMLAAHMDEVGLMVKAVTADGYLRFVPLGYWWSQTLLAGPVRIRGRHGEVAGVIGAKPPHYMTAKEQETVLPVTEMFIDVGARSAAELAALGVGPGDPIVPGGAPFITAGGAMVMGKAMDDRVGLLAVIESAKRLAGMKRGNSLFAVGTVQEEVGLRGARTAARKVQPDLCLVIEGGPADDLPGRTREMVQGALGGGPQIRMYDPSMVGYRPLADLALAVGSELGLATQVLVRETGGTDGGAIHISGAGIPTLVIAVPVRYAHSHLGLCSLADLEATIELLTALVGRLDAAKLAELTEAR